ncbi:MAG: hypothetical protein IPP08_00975 [Chlorobiota bacterium]|jgi:S-adenosylmethionine:tRNA-ribosyltransferase-isomerase (queuine synthetase)|nr:hypothetical protein [Chlorobiota bacterium]QQS66782.1 MAG: hypothetical protein IPP08_00975 [Chlorobiota bacterium]
MKFKLNYLIHYNNIVLFVLLIQFCYSCTNNTKVLDAQLPCENLDSKYSSSIKVIINSTCMNARCHDGAGVAPTNYATYEGLMVSVNLGTFKNRVLEKKDMPVNLSLSDLELKKISCWLDDGAKNN